MLTTKKLILMLLSIFSVLLTIIFSIIFVNRLVMPYNSEGNYFDKGNAVVYNEQAVLVYGILLIISIARESLCQISYILLHLLTQYEFCKPCTLICFKNLCAVNFRKLANAVSFPFNMCCCQIKCIWVGIITNE